ncbi:MAG: hypothetical protein Q8P46_14525 [Hyphomicrobiales bacterium]|nr:hypothetical protein [Hyphomicrobiales bacterium]
MAIDTIFQGSLFTGDLIGISRVRFRLNPGSPVRAQPSEDTAQSFVHGKFLILAPLWRLMRIMMNAAPEPAARPRINLRLAPELWRAIDESRRRRPGTVSRNTWITEAVLEKLERSPPDKTPGEDSDA